jgi:membrane associated rhomboid family serine protease
VTLALIAVNFVVFGLQHLSGGSGIHDLSGAQIDNLELNLDLQSKFWANGHPIGVANGEWYRLFTAMFLHQSFWHIASNMVVLYFIGPILEMLLGRMRFLLVYIVSGLAGNAVSYFFMPAVAAALGASGAIAGVFGCLVVVGLRHRLLDPLMIVLVLVLSIVTPLQSSNVDWRAHLGGFTAGLLMGLTYAFIPEILRALGREPGGGAENARVLNTVQFGTMAVILAVAAVLTAVHTSALNDPANRLRPVFGSAAAPAPTSESSRTPVSYPQDGTGYPHWG